MLTIQIKDKNNKVIAVINDIFSLQVNDEVNKWGKLKMRFPVESRMQKKPIEKCYKISISYWLKIWKTVKLFDWYITDVIVKTSEVEIQAENWLSYLQRRIIRIGHNYTNTPIKNVISEIFNELNSTVALPITLWLNDCETTITRQFDKWTKFFDILKYCRESEKDLIVRVLDWVLEVSKNTGEVLEWVREYDVENSRWTNIVDWSWKDSLDEFYSYIQNKNGSINNAEFYEDTWLIFEKYEWEGSLSLPTGEAIPSVSVSRDTDWWSFNIWDRKGIRIYTGYDWLELEYLWLIQSRKITIDSRNGIKAEVKISEKYKSDTNILDILLTNLRNK